MEEIRQSCLRACIKSGGCSRNYTRRCTWLESCWCRFLPSAAGFVRATFAVAVLLRLSMLCILPSGRWPFSTTAYGRCHVVSACVPAGKIFIQCLCQLAFQLRVLLQCLCQLALPAPSSSSMPLPACCETSSAIACPMPCQSSLAESQIADLSTRCSVLSCLYSFVFSDLPANDEHVF